MYRHIKETISNGVLISSGAIPGQVQFRKFGFNDSIGTAQTYVGGIGGTEPYSPTAAAPIRAFSDGAADSTGSTGAHEIIVQGLDGGFLEIEEALTMNATSVTVASSQSFIRVHRSFVSVPGVYRGTNVGEITIETTAGTAFGMISSGAGQTQLTGYCVPAGKSLYVDVVNLTVQSNQTVDVIFWQAPNANVVSAPFSGARRLVQRYDGLSGPNNPIYAPPLVFDAYTDMWFTAAVSAGSGSVSAEYSGILKEEMS